MSNSSEDPRPRAEIKTVVFTDIVGSTRLQMEQGEIFFQILDEYFRITEKTSAECGGQVIKTLGDGALLLFDDATAALTFAQLLIRRLSSESMTVGASEVKLRLRVGISTGAVAARDTAY